MNTELLVADYQNDQHARDILYLLDHYARDPAGGGRPLPENVSSNLIAELAKRPQAFSVLYYQNNEPCGLANCFEGFSTFKCKPLVNIHDFVVIKPLRGTGVSKRLLQKVEEVARLRGCCKLTLEVLENNTAAKAAYVSFGFQGYALDPNMGSALFWEKSL